VDVVFCALRVVGFDGGPVIRTVTRFAACFVVLTDWLKISLAASLSGEPAPVAQHARTTSTPTRTQAQTRRSRAATATPPATPEARRTVGGFSTFTNPNATRIAHAAFHFDTGH
jgi:hypothetical protein